MGSASVLDEYWRNVAREVWEITLAAARELLRVCCEVSFALESLVPIIGASVEKSWSMCSNRLIWICVMDRMMPSSSCTCNRSMTNFVLGAR